LKQVLSEWWEHTGKSEETIINDLVDKASEEWKRRVGEEGIKPNNSTIDKYIAEAETRLRKRRVSDKHIEQITSKLKHRMTNVVAER